MRYRERVAVREVRMALAAVGKLAGVKCTQHRSDAAGMIAVGFLLTPRL